MTQSEDGLDPQIRGSMTRRPNKALIILDGLHTLSFYFKQIKERALCGRFSTFFPRGESE